MRFEMIRSWLPLALLLALPALDAGNRATAAFVGGVSLRSPALTLPSELGLVPRGLDSDLDLAVSCSADGAQSEPADDNGERLDPAAQAKLHARLAKLRTHLNEPSSAGTGAAPSGPSPGSQVGLAERPEVPTSELVTRLYADDRLLNPPPLLLGLFRPPRVAA